MGSAKDYIVFGSAQTKTTLSSWNNNLSDTLQSVKESSKKTTSSNSQRNWWFKIYFGS